MHKFRFFIIAVLLMAPLAALHAAELDLYFDKDGQLIGEAAQKQAAIAPACEPFEIKDGWNAVAGQEAPNTLTQEIFPTSPTTPSFGPEVRLKPVLRGTVK